MTIRKIYPFWLILFFLASRPTVAQESAIFYPLFPPGPVQAGMSLVFNVSITNTGTESWVSGTFLVFVKIYNFEKEYLTETDRIRQLVDIEPGETVSVEMRFEIPIDYGGIYYSTFVDYVSEEDQKLTWTTESVDLSFRYPGLPLLTVIYDIDETKGASGASIGFPIDDVTSFLQ